MRKVLLLAAALGAALALVPAAGAITWGQRDGTAHPNVGAVVGALPTGERAMICSGTLIAPQVFLTASHCGDGLQSLGISALSVTFDTNSALGPYYRGTLRTNPLYNAAQSDPQDIAVIMLDKTVKGIVPALLPKAGLLDQMKAAGTLNGTTTFTAVGYGDRERVLSQGGPAFQFDGYRWNGVSSFNALTNSWLRLSQNNATGDGGTCYGDSGGPDFLGASQVVAGITITGDSQCVATNVDYRLDTQSARAFLGRFVALP